jgi:ABC-2 type transport system ATP-binding protein
MACQTGTRGSPGRCCGLTPGRTLRSVIAAIETHDLTRDFGTLRALDSLTLQVEQGEIFGFLGPNGAGKSTAIRLLLDLIRPTRGRASVLGHDCQSASMEVRRQVGFLPGDVRLYPNLSGRQMLEHFASLREVGVEESRALELADRLELRLDVKSSAYSKGNRQKLGLVLALMGAPRVLILDEPSSGLDPLIQHELWDLLHERAREGVTVFFSSHVMSEVELVCERVGILREGKLAAVDTVADMKVRAVRQIVVRFEGSAPPPEHFAIDGVHELRRDSDLVEFEVEGAIDSLVKAIAEHRVVDLQTEQPTLEELLMTYYAREAQR